MNFPAGFVVDRSSLLIPFLSNCPFYGRMAIEPSALERFSRGISANERLVKLLIVGIVT